MINSNVILYMSEDYPYSKVHHDLCCHLVKKSHKSLLLYSVIRSKIRKRDLRSMYECRNYDILYYKLDGNEWRYKYDFFYKIRVKYEWLIKHCDINKIGLVHAATLFSEGAVALKLYRERGIPYIVSVRGSDINFYCKYMPHVWKIGLEVLRHANYVVFLTSNGVKQFKKTILGYFFPLNQLKTKIIPNGIDDYWLTHRHNKKKIIFPYRILYIGIFKKNKNVILLLKSVLKLKDKYPNLEITLVGGGGEEHDKVIKLCSLYPNTFKYIGKISDIEQLCHVMSEHDIFAMISHSETFGLVYLEALSQGLPILYSKGQGVDGVFTDKIGESAFSTKGKSVIEGLERIINTYASYPIDEIDLRRFSWEFIAKSYIKLYNV